MTKEEFMLSAHQDPLPNLGYPRHPYTCHMAALHWALMSDGRGKGEASRIVNDITKTSCRVCQSGANGVHESISGHFYSKTFCSAAKRLDRGTDFRLQADSGDLILLGGLDDLTHSMVSVEVAAADIVVRGFNNQGTFGLNLNMKNVYDNNDRRLTQSPWWNDPNSRFWRLSYAGFIRAIRAHLAGNSLARPSVRSRTCPC